MKMKQNRSFSSQNPIKKLENLQTLPRRLHVPFETAESKESQCAGEKFTYLIPPSSPKARKEEAELAKPLNIRFDDGFTEENLEEEGFFPDEDELSFELAETSTDCIFFLPSTVAGKSEEQVKRVKDLNREYEARVMNIQGCGTETYTQTFQPFSCSRSTQKSFPTLAEQSTQVNTYDFFEGKVDQMPTNLSLKTMEKVVLQNALSSKEQEEKMLKPTSCWSMNKADEFDLDDKSESPEDPSAVKIESPQLQKAWTHNFQKLHGYPVNQLEWNTKNEELLAAAYGDTSFANKSAGRIALWTLKNPEAPEKFIETTSSCTCIRFSKVTPHLLAAGFFDGTIQIYDIRANPPRIVADCSEIGRHQSSVWQVEWMLQTEDDIRKDDVQHILSTGADGIVKQWMVRKGAVVSCTDSMKLKQVPNQARLKGSSNDRVGHFQEALGSTIMPSQTDSNLYYVATEDGLVHKCSISYKEQYLKSYFGHFRRVHRLKNSPFNSNFFITCGEDWRINIWDENVERPMVSLEPGTSSVRDCDWCPFNSCVIGGCLNDGTILVWDLLKNQVDPTITFTSKDNSTTALRFAPHALRLYVGDANGAITCYYLKNIDYLPDENESAKSRSLDRLNSCMVNSERKTA